MPLQTVTPEVDQCRLAGGDAASTRDAAIVSPASVLRKALPFSGHEDPDSFAVIAKPCDRSWDAEFPALKWVIYYKGRPTPFGRNTKGGGGGCVH